MSLQLRQLTSEAGPQAGFLAQLLLLLLLMALAGLVGDAAMMAEIDLNLPRSLWLTVLMTAKEAVLGCAVPVVIWTSLLTDWLTTTDAALQAAVTLLIQLDLVRHVSAAAQRSAEVLLKWMTLRIDVVGRDEADDKVAQPW